jgi:hypothetical protein
MSKYCKKCGKEIPQTSKKDLCEYHQNEENGKIRKIGEGVLGLVVTAVSIGLLVITKGKFGGPKT